MAGQSKLAKRQAAAAFFAVSWSSRQRRKQRDVVAAAQAEYVDVVCLPGGAGTARPDRSTPLTLFPDVEGNAGRQMDVYISPFWLLYIGPDAPATNPLSCVFKNFRKLFRVPLAFFRTIVAEAAASENWRDVPAPGEKGVAGQKPKPLSMKVLCVLRILAVGCDPSAMFEPSGISREVLQKFMYGVAEGKEKCIGFVEWYQEHFAKEISGLESEDEILKSAAVFNGLGLPGCVASEFGPCLQARLHHIYLYFIGFPIHMSLTSMMSLLE